MYPLQALFEIRERAKKEKEEVYAKEKSKLDEAKKALHEMEEKLKKMKELRAQKQEENYEAMCAQEISIEKIRMGQRYIQRLLAQEQEFQIQIEHQKELVQIAEESVKKALELMQKTTEEFKILEKHKEKWAFKQKKERERKEESEVDDITQARFNLKTKEQDHDGSN